MPALFNQPLVTIGAGALPLPTKQPAKLKEATTNASAKAVFFIRFPPSLSELVVDAENERLDMRLVARISARYQSVGRRPVA